MGRIYNNIVETVGRTPLVKLNKVTAGLPATILLKCEFFNPLGSVKDRLAIAIIEDAERRGTLKPGQTVVEATSGNTGIALAMVCAAKGYPFVAVMTETFSVERRRIMRLLGATVILTPAAERGSGIGAALTQRLHAELDAAGVPVTLLHYAQVNPLSAPFWNRMGYRPLWTMWEIQPAGALR